MPFPQQGMPAMGANPIAQNEEQIKGGKQCTTCGKTIHQDAVACPKCGCEQVHTEHDSGVGAGIMGFLSVGAGLALNSAWKESKPKHAKSALIGAIAGIVARVGILGGIVALVFVYVLPFIASIPAIC